MKVAQYSRLNPIAETASLSVIYDCTDGFVIVVTSRLTASALRIYIVDT